MPWGEPALFSMSPRIPFATVLAAGLVLCGPSRAEVVPQYLECGWDEMYRRTPVFESVVGGSTANYGLHRFLLDEAAVESLSIGFRFTSGANPAGAVTIPGSPQPLRRLHRIELVAP